MSEHPAASGVIARIGHEVWAVGAGRATTFAISAGGRMDLTADEVRRVERALAELVVESGQIPTMRAVANRSGVPRSRLRRAIGTVLEAVLALIDERLAMARACNDMPTGWHPSISVFAGRLVTHRLFVYSIVRDALPMIATCPTRSGRLADLDGMFRDELGYQVGRLGVFEAPSLPAVVDELGELLSIERICSLGTGNRVDLERMLNDDLVAVLARHGVFHRWNECRHEWFDGLDSTPASGAPLPPPPPQVAPVRAAS